MSSEGTETRPDSEPVQELLVVTGPPGAGKSTVAAMVAGRFDRSVLIEGDSFFGFIARGAIAPWLEGSHEQNDVVVTAAAAATGAFVRGGFITVGDVPGRGVGGRGSTTE